MFEIGWTELLLIAVVAIIVIGPKELPQVMRSAGRALNKLRRSGDDFRRQFEESVRDSGFEDIQKDLRDLRNLNPAQQIRNSIEEAMKPVALPASPLDPVPPSSPSKPAPPDEAGAQPVSAAAVNPANALDAVPHSDPDTGKPLQPAPLTAADRPFDMPAATPVPVKTPDKAESAAKPNGHHIGG